MTYGNRSVETIRSRSGIVGIAFALLMLGACTRPNDPQGSAEANNGSPAPIALPTGTGPAEASTEETDADLYPDPLRDHEVVPGRRIKPASVAFPAIWPETSRADLARVQLATLQGRERWRLDPQETAERFATEILGWDRGDVRSQVRPPRYPWWPMCEVEVWRAGKAPVTISMQAFGRYPWDGTYTWRSVIPGWAWSVLRVDTELLDLDALFDERDPSLLRVAGVMQVRDPARIEMTVDLFDGPLGSSPVPFPGKLTSTGGDSFHIQGAVGSPEGDSSIALGVTLTGRGSGALLGVEAIPLWSPLTPPGITLDDQVAPDRRIWPVASRWYVPEEDAPSFGFLSSRGSSIGTAERFAVEVLGWAPEDVASLGLDGWFSTVVAVWNERMQREKGPLPISLITVEQEVLCSGGALGRCIFNPSGYWSIASVDTALVDLDGRLTSFSGGQLQIGASLDAVTGSRHLESNSWMGPPALGHRGSAWSERAQTPADRCPCGASTAGAG